MDRMKEIAALMAGQQPLAPMNIMPPVAQRPSFPPGSSPDYIAMMNGMLRSGTITPQQYQQMQADPRQWEGVSNPPQSSEIR